MRRYADCGKQKGVDLATAERAEHLRAQVYARSAVGCCWHLVLSDRNVDAESVRWSHEQALQAGHEDCIELGPILQKMSRTQRLKLLKGGYTPRDLHEVADPKEAVP